MNNTVKELSEAVRRYAAEQGEEFDLRKNADLVHFGMWLLSQNSGKPMLDGAKPEPLKCIHSWDYTRSRFYKKCLNCGATEDPF